MQNIYNRIGLSLSSGEIIFLFFSFADHVAELGGYLETFAVFALLLMFMLQFGYFVLFVCFADYVENAVFRKFQLTLLVTLIVSCVIFPHNVTTYMLAMCIQFIMCGVSLYKHRFYTGGAE